MQAVGYEVNRHCFPLLAVPVGCGLVFPASSPPPSRRAFLFIDVHAGIGLVCAEF